MKNILGNSKFRFTKWCFGMALLRSEPRKLNRSFGGLRASLLLALTLGWMGATGWGQTTIGVHDFETSNASPALTRTTATVSGSPATSAASSGNSGSSAAPANADLFASGSRGYRASGPSSGSTAAVVRHTFSAVDTRNFTSISVRVRVAAISGNSSNGVDSDYCEISVSPDGGTTWYQQSRITGGTNVRWAFTGTGSATRAYQANNTFTGNAVSGNSSTVTGSSAITTMTVTDLPAVESLQVRVTTSANDANESWVIDDIIISGTGTAPVVAASAATGVTGTGATLNGNVTSDGGATVTERGFVYNTSSPVTINDNKTIVSGTTGAFSNNVSSLTTGATYYFRAYASNSVGVTLSLEQNFTTGAIAGPTLIPATLATVDTAFEVTFPDDATWRGVISGVKVDGVALEGGFVVSSGKITFTPSSSVPTAALQSPGTKSITVLATGYNDATVSQVLGAGQASKLVITTQPTAPTANGGALVTQPVVALQDQYGNATASTANVTAEVGAGTWTFGGTATVAAVNGTATFLGLTATSAAAVTGATISFTSDSLTRVTSSTFDIPAPVPPGEILISQVYGAGGNSGATYNQDYVELYNPGAVDKDLSGWSIQYASNTGTTWSVQSLTGTIKAGKYFLVSLASGSIGSGLPTADYAGTATGTGSVNLSGSNGKVALANTTTAFTTAFPTGAVDFVGYGTATSFEGSAAAPAPSTTTAIFRAGNGATDSNNNSADFTAAAPNPRNSTFGEAVGTITLNPTSITNLTAPVGGVSAVQSYVVVGTNLGTTNLVVTPSLSLIQISTNASSGFSTNSIPFVPVEGVVSNTIYVRVTNATATNYSGTITNASGLASANLPVSGTIYALADYYSMASGNYSETFSNIASWTTPTTGSWQGLVSGGTNTIPVATNITTATLAFSSSSSTGVQKGTENLQFLTTGTTDNSTSIGLDLLLNFTGRNAGTLSFDAATVFNSTGDRVSTLRAYTSINGTDWSELTTGGLPFVSTNNVAGSSNISVSLPRSFDNAPQAQIRFYVYNGEGAGTRGSRPKISIDNVAVTSTEPSVLTAPTITSTNAFSGTVGVAFSNTITATGSAPIAFSGTDLPGGLSVVTNGLISGTPSAAGTFTNAVLTATNAAGTNNQAVTFTIAKGTPIITAVPMASAITDGQALSASALSGGTASVAGAFAWTAPSTLPGVGSPSYGVTFTPTDTANYNTATTTVSVTVNSADTPQEQYLASYGLVKGTPEAAGTADPDGDGLSNVGEFAFGTSPVSGASRAVTQESVVGGIKIKWLQRSEFTYTVKSTDNLGSAFLGTVSSSPVSPQPSGLGDYQQYEATLTGGDRGFIKVEAIVP